MDIRDFENLPIMGILRSIDYDLIDELVQTMISSGLKTVEVAMNTSGAEKQIRKIVEISKGCLCVGAGTVLKTDDLKKALDYGATFIVTPVLVGEVLEYCVKNSICVFPGALTPGEIYNAWGMGATMVKVFPAKFFGPTYFKEIKGPFDRMKLLACGGVNSDNIKSFFLNGANAVAFGGSIFRKELLESRDFLRIGENIKTLISAYKQ